MGPNVTDVQVKDTVIYRKTGAFAEYAIVPVSDIYKVPSADPKYLPLVVSGMGGSVALEQKGKLSSNETVLVTAAAGGTGQFVVQLAKLAGNHVIGTCSTQEKAQRLKAIGCDRVIVYTEEDISEVLKKEYPKGVDLVFESVGGATFKACAENLAVQGRLIIFGYVSNYLEDHRSEAMTVSELAPCLLSKSATVSGFIMGHHNKYRPAHMKKLLGLIEEGKLDPGLDKTVFHGLEKIPEALDHMYAKKNTGKIVVDIRRQ